MLNDFTRVLNLLLITTFTSTFLFIIITVPFNINDSNLDIIGTPFNLVSVFINVKRR